MLALPECVYKAEHLTQGNEATLPQAWSTAMETTY